MIKDNEGEGLDIPNWKYSPPLTRLYVMNNVSTKTEYAILTNRIVCIDFNTTRANEEIYFEYGGYDMYTNDYISQKILIDEMNIYTMDPGNAGVVYPMYRQYCICWIRSK